jgi:hypothetical protein
LCDGTSDELLVRRALAKMFLVRVWRGCLCGVQATSAARRRGAGIDIPPASLPLALIACCVALFGPAATRVVLVVLCQQSVRVREQGGGRHWPDQASLRQQRNRREGTLFLCVPRLHRGRWVCSGMMHAFVYTSPERSTFIHPHSNIRPRNHTCQAYTPAPNMHT